MRYGLLSDLFTGVAVKQLTLVETISKRSHQHEFQGVKQLRNLFGPEDLRNIPARFIWLSTEQEAFTEDGFVSWSNVRKGKPRAPEYHLYYSGNTVTRLMQPRDAFFLALRKDGSVLIVIAPSLTIQNQLMWLFGMHEPLSSDFSFQKIDSSDNAELDFTARYILDELGLDLAEPDTEYLDNLIEPFGFTFPASKKLADLARNSLHTKVSAQEDPDGALIAWLDREEQLFKRLERRIVAKRLEEGFRDANHETDIDGFVSFSLSVQNRRKVRMGYALENHLEVVFIANKILFKRNAITENRVKPDFLFPDAKSYHNPAFPAEKLTMLGAKSTLKDRWRQVLSEAKRISPKHLLTLEPGISENQTDEMQANNLQLVVPKELYSTYKQAQQAWLMNLREFISLVRAKQNM